jgi:hypothetical protein
VRKIFEEAPEPAARGAREKTPPPHNTAPARGQGACDAPADAADGPASKRAKDAKSTKRRIEKPALPLEAQAPALSGGFRPAEQTPRLETASGEGENAPPRAKSGAKRAPASARVARPRLGPAARRLRAWLRRQFGDQIESCRPMVEELLSIVDRLERLRAELDAGGLTPAERARLVRIEIQASGAFARCWRLLGLADDAPATMPPGRPPRLE